MTVGIFNKLNLLRTSAAAEKPGYSGAAQTAVANSYGAALTALVWSQSLANAALDFVNEFGTVGTVTEATIFLTA